MSEDTEQETVGVEVLELMGAIMAHNAADLAHTNEILLAMAEDKTKFFAKALYDLWEMVERAIPAPLRPMAIEHALQAVDWKVAEAVKYIDPDGEFGMNERGSF